MQAYWFSFSQGLCRSTILPTLVGAGAYLQYTWGKGRKYTLDMFYLGFSRAFGGAFIFAVETRNPGCPSIHPLCYTLSASGVAELPAHIGWSLGIHPGQITSPSLGTHTPFIHMLTPTGNFRGTNEPKHAWFWTEMKPGVPGENPHRHKENMQTPQLSVWPGYEPGSFLLWGHSTNHWATMWPGAGPVQLNSDGTG